MIDELHTVARRKGFGSLDGAEAVVLEAGGEMSVIAARNVGDGAALGQLVVQPGVGGPDEAERGS